VQTVTTDVLIVGAGPAGLAGAIELKRLGVGKVLVVDREKEAGGIPRHSNHIGFGIADMHRFLTGPAYAARYVRLAQEHGVELRTETTVTNWQKGTNLSATSPLGLLNIEAQAVLLATGCRERPRAARLIPGNRPQGVFTTGMLQNLVYVQHQSIGKCAVVIGAEHVSFSAVLTLRHAGANVLALVTDFSRHQSFFQYKLISADRYRVPIYTNMRLTHIIGQKRVEAIELTDARDGSVRQIACDTVVFTGDWIPDCELAFYGGLSMDQKSKAPSVNQFLQTSRTGVFAAGNVIHAAETADVAALSGRYAARQVQTYLRNGEWTSQQSLPIQLAEPFAWVSPNRIVRNEPVIPHGHFILRVTKILDHPTVEVWQGSRHLWSRPYRRLIPNLPVYLSDRWLQQINASDEPIRIDLR
jgi:thioredoxin reductase